MAKSMEGISKLFFSNLAESENIESLNEYIYKKFRQKNSCINSSIIEAAITVVEGTNGYIASISYLHDKLTALIEKTYWVYEHSLNVCILSVIIGKEIGLTKAELNDLAIGAIFHDIGKVYIPSNILNKNRKLSEEEYIIMKKHTTMGLNIMKNCKLNPVVNEIILQHHERINGLGYPNGLYEEQINICSQIVAITDVFEALSSDRPYRGAFKLQEAVNIIRLGKHIEFNPVLVEVLESIIE